MNVLLDCSFEAVKTRIDFKIKKYNASDIIPIHIELNKHKNNNIEFNVELLKEYIRKIQELYPNYNFEFKLSYKMDTTLIIDTDQYKNIEELDNYLRETYNTEILIEDKILNWKYGFRQTLLANRALDSIAQKIKNTNYSNFEKFMIAYEYVTNYAYNEGGDITHETTNYWIPVINGDKITCGGYASLLEALCSKIFDQNEVKVLSQTLYSKKRNQDNADVHANNIIFIKDEKYGIDGLFHVDSCWDCISEKRKDKPQAYCCIPLQNLIRDKVHTYRFNNSFENIYLLQFEEYRNTLNNNEYTIEDCIKKIFINSGTTNPNKEYYLNRFNDLIDIDHYTILTQDDLKEISQLILEKTEQIAKIYAKELSKYNDIKISSLPQKYINTWGLHPYIVILENKSSTKEEIINAINNIGTIFYAHKDEIEELHKSTDSVSSFKYYISSIIAKSFRNDFFSEVKAKKEAIIEKDTQSNITKFMTNLNKLANSHPIPIEAFITSYEILGKQLGLKGKELKEYVKNRLIKSIERTHELFDVENCTSCFATTQIEDIEKGVIKIR